MKTTLLLGLDINWKSEQKKWYDVITSHGDIIFPTLVSLEWEAN